MFYFYNYQILIDVFRGFLRKKKKNLNNTIYFSLIFVLLNNIFYLILCYSMKDKHILFWSITITLSNLFLEQWFWKTFLPKCIKCRNGTNKNKFWKISFEKVPRIQKGAVIWNFQFNLGDTLLVIRKPNYQIIFVVLMEPLECSALNKNVIHFMLFIRRIKTLEKEKRKNKHKKHTKITKINTLITSFNHQINIIK